MPVVEYRSKPSALLYMARAVLPLAARRAPLSAPELLLRWTGVRAATRDVDAACALAEQPRCERLPFLYFQIVGFRLHMALLTHGAFPVPIWRMLQVRNRIVEHRALLRSCIVDLELRLAALRMLDKGLEADLHMSVTESGGLAWESINTFYARGRFGPASAQAADSPAAPEGKPIAEWTAATGGAWRFAGLTGDYNPLHLVDARARRGGFPRAFLHAQRVLGACLARLPEPPRSLEAWIKGPVPYGARVRLRAREEEGACRFALWTELDARPAIVGRVASA
jgi:hypothetical protein